MPYNNLVVITRRQMVVAWAAGVAGCRPRRGSGFPGYAFVADEEAQSLAVVNLTTFALERHINLGASPTSVVADSRRAAVYALTPLTGTLHEIDPQRMSVRRRVRIGQRLASMRLAPEGGALWLSSSEPQQMVRVPLERFQADARVPLPAAPAEFDLTADGRLCAVTHGVQGLVSFLDLKAGRMLGSVRAGETTGVVRFRGDGKVVLVGDSAGRLVVVLDPAAQAVVTRLQVAVRPAHFCFKPDGGEMFVTGEGVDAVVILNPFSAEVAETALAGRAPGAMAFSRSPEYLFVTNPPSGDVTILDPETRRVVAVVAVGMEPFYVTITPDGEYALILNRRSGTMAVVRPAAVVRGRARGAPLYTTIPVGPKPVAAAVLAV